MGKIPLDSRLCNIIYGIEGVDNVIIFKATDIRVVSDLAGLGYFHVIVMIATFLSDLLHKGTTPIRSIFCF